MTTSEARAIYHAEKSRASERTAARIDALREAFERIYPPTRKSYSAQNKAYYVANKARIQENRRARAKKRRVSA